MNHSHYQDCYIPLGDTVVKSCKFYVEYWKQLKEKKIHLFNLIIQLKKLLPIENTLKMITYCIIFVLIVCMKLQ